MTSHYMTDDVRTALPCHRLEVVFSADTRMDVCSKDKSKLKMSMKSLGGSLGFLLFGTRVFLTDSRLFLPEHVKVC